MISIVTGHYGSGKTEFALNLALKKKAEGKRVTICDLDIVNPYFRKKQDRPPTEQSLLKNTRHNGEAVNMVSYLP